MPVKTETPDSEFQRYARICEESDNLLTASFLTE